MKHFSGHFTRIAGLIIIILITMSLLQGCSQSTTDVLATPTQPELHFIGPADNDKYGRVELAGLDPEILALLSTQDYLFETLSPLLAIYTAADGDAQTIASRPLVGDFSIEDGRIRLHPRYPFEPGVTYVAQAELATLGTLLPNQHGSGSLHEAMFLELTFSLPKPVEESSTTVSNVFPSAALVPENLLRFYIHFSGPMRRGEAYNHIQILDAQGEIVERPFLRIGRELWNPAMTRLTVMLDPGRIKRDMAPNLQAGLPFVSGDSYQLVIDEQWADANGNSLTETYQKTFRVDHADFISPQATDWQVTTPTVNTVAPLIVHFSEPLDHALLQRLISVQYLDSAEGTDPMLINGVIAVINDEMQWHFIPVSPWQQGQYQLVVSTLLEDIAGNSLRRPFDTDLQDTATQADIKDIVKLIFRIG